ncbi:MAG: transporter substrate-binding domain-containing protein [Caldisericia bacterium]|nr:transporter substrate-binding domain-containing protein [Caldisericia bacterium]
MKKMGCLMVAFMFVFVMFIGCGPKESNTLVVGMELAYPPFETKDDAGNPMGVSVDLAYALGDYLGKEVRIENVNWDGLIPSLQTGKVDIVISSMTATEDREKVVDFSIPYAHSYLALLVNKESGIQSIEDLYDKDRVIAVKKGTTGYIYATTSLIEAQVHSFTSENACVTEVMQGKADAFIYDQLTIYRQNQSHPDTTEAILIPFQEGENWAMAVKAGNSDLLQPVNQFIEMFIHEGGFEVITEKYLQKEKEIFDSLGFPWFFSE